MKQDFYPLCHDVWNNSTGLLVANAKEQRRVNIYCSLLNMVLHEVLLPLCFFNILSSGLTSICFHYTAF
jgi:hypothetical protein